MKLFVSSLAFIGQPTETIIQTCIKESFALEFSSGMPYREDMVDLFLKAELDDKLAHNYFPAPQLPFVLNLASADETIRERSIEHCIKGLQLSSKVNAPFFSAHAGFCIDPKPEELGKMLNKAEHIDKPYHWSLFKLSLNTILEEAKKLGMRFLIENNVLAKMNLYENGTNPLFCVDAQEMKQLMQEMAHPQLGLLYDTAHAKVSAKTLNLNLSMEYDLVKEDIYCYHHSDNDGDLDTNQKINTDYWFATKFSDCATKHHVVEVKKLNPEEINEQLHLLKHFSNETKSL